MTVNQLLVLITRVTFILIALITLIDYFRLRRKGYLDVVLMFGSMAVIVTFQFLADRLTSEPEWFGKVPSLLLVAHPYLLLRLVGHLRRIPRRMYAFGVGGTLASMLLVAFLPSPLPAPVAVLIVIYFVIVEIYASVALVRGALTTSGVTHWRLLFAALGSVFIALVIVIAGINAVFPDAARFLSPLSQFMGVLSVVSYFIGFATPAWLLRTWQFNELHQYLQGGGGDSLQEPFEASLLRLCESSARAVGGLEAAVAVFDEGQGKYRIAVSTGGPGNSYIPGGSDIEESLRGQRARLINIGADQDGGQVFSRQGGSAVLSVPVQNREKTWGYLLVMLWHQPLFPDDDLALLKLYAEQTAIRLGYIDLLEKQRLYSLDLEKRVAERTDQLQQAVKDLESEISARKQTAMTLVILQQRLQFLLSATPAIIYSAQPGEELRTTFISDNVFPQLGFEPEKFLDDPGFWFEQVHPEERDMIAKGLGQLSGRDSYIYEYRFRNREGEYRWMMDEGRIVRDADGNPVEIVGYWIDITERKEVEESVKQLNAELQKSAHELHATNKELESFAYSVSHDLRAPLRAIDGFSQILLNQYTSALSEEAQNYFQRIIKNTKQMGELIDELLSFSRLGRQAMKITRVQPEEIVKSALARLEYEIDSREIDIILGELPACRADASLLTQVFINLISNAIKFTRTRERACIEIGATQQGAENVYFVKDNGVGFSMEYAGKLFGVFQRLHRSEDYEGTGVGLANVQRIIHRHGGRVWAEGVENEGATFYFSIPR